MGSIIIDSPHNPDNRPRIELPTQRGSHEERDDTTEEAFERNKENAIQYVYGIINPYASRVNKGTYHSV